jgi:hypothetical protein
MQRMSNGSLGKLLRRGADSFDIAGHQRFDYLVPTRRVLNCRQSSQYLSGNI